MSPFVYFRVIRFVPRSYSSSAHHHNLFFLLSIPDPFPQENTTVVFYMFIYVYTFICN